MSVSAPAHLIPPATKRSIIFWQLVILIGLTLTRGVIYLSVFPPWVAPDEPAHFEAIRILGQEQQIPSYSYYASKPVNVELSQSFQMFRMWELLERPTPAIDNNDLSHISFINYPYPGRLIYADTYPILPHMLLAPISRLAASFDIATELYLLRFVSVALAIVVTLLAWLITRRVFPDQPQFWLAIPAFIIFLPMHTHIFASLNTDVFAIVLASILLLLLVSFFDQGASIFKIIWVACLLLLALFIKRTIIFTFLWVGIVAILYLGYRRNWPLKRVILIGSIILTCLGVGLWLVIINSYLLADSLITLFNMNIGKSLPFFYLLNQNLSSSEIITIYIKSGLFAFITFWGDFGGANINIPWPWAWGLMLLSGLIILGACLYTFDLFRNNEKMHGHRQIIFIIFIAGIILSLSNAFFPILVSGPTWGPPARYFFPVIIPIATFFFLGVWQLFPANYRQSYLLPLWLLGLVSYDALVMTQVLIPFLYG
jgi:hypothetical protein